MKAYVFTDKSIERYAGRFVWLSINTERAENAAFLKRLPIPALPTILVLSPQGEVTLRYVGGATVPQLRKMLDDAEQTHRSRSASIADKLLTEADRLGAQGKHAEAATKYNAALKNAPGRWSKLPRTAEGLLFALSMANERENCATRARTLYARVKGTTASANVAAIGLSCALGLDEKHPQRATLIEWLERATRDVVDNPKIVISDDDRSGVYTALIAARESAKDDEGTARLTAEWSAFLEGAAARAKTPEQRTVYDSHRLSAYMDLRTPEKAVPMLEQSERDFPDDYNPPARLALAYKEMKEYDKALAASDRALARVYGPRKITVLSVRADIYTAKGDLNAARETIAAAIEHAKSLPDGQRSEGRIAALEKRLASMK